MGQHESQQKAKHGSEYYKPGVEHIKVSIEPTKLVWMCTSP